LQIAITSLKGVPCDLPVWERETGETGVDEGDLVANRRGRRNCAVRRDEPIQSTPRW
jgi:hypothetical protein